MSHVWIFRDTIWEKSSVSIWLQNDGIYDIAAGRTEYPCVATRLGVYKKRPDIYNWINVGVTETAWEITCDTDGTFWFTMENKIGSYDGETVNYYSIYNSDIPPSDDYIEICADSLGRLWLETDSSLYVRENDEWRCIIPSFKGWLVNVFVDDYYNTWVLSNSNLYLMNQSDTIVFNYENAPFASRYFRGGTPGPDNSFYISSYGEITTVQYTVLEEIEEQPNTQQESKPWLSVFPNPAEGFVTFEVLGEGLFSKTDRSIVEIKNLLGQSVAGFSFEGKSVRWDTKSLKPGIYIYQIRQGHRKSSGKLVVR
jgi:ligand-binding sensor domain-containing protein